MAEREFSTKEQLDFLNGQVGLLQAVAKAFADSEFASEEAKRDLELMKSIRDRLKFTYLLEECAAAQNNVAVINNKTH